MFMWNNTLFKLRVKIQQEVTGNCYKGPDMAFQGGGWLHPLGGTLRKAEACREVPVENHGLVPAC